jgi:chromosome segregation ATPase
MDVCDEIMDEMVWHEPDEQPSTRWCTRLNALQAVEDAYNAGIEITTERIAELKAERQEKDKRIAELEAELDLCLTVHAKVNDEKERLRDAAAEFLHDLEERAKVMAHHPDESIRDHYENGMCLPVGDGVLFNLREALKEIE